MTSETNQRLQHQLRENDGYLQTIDRLEPNIYTIDAGAGWASAAISLKRIADELNVANRLEALRQHSDAIVDSEKHVQWLRDHELEHLIDSLPIDKLGAAVLEGMKPVPKQDDVSLDANTRMNDGTDR